MQDSHPEPRIKIGISSCLLGMKVRFDGGHKHDRYLTETLGRYFEWVAVCPEVEIGMSTPRENIRLVGEAADPRLIAPKSGSDYTERMKAYAEQQVAALAREELHGYILKKDSPSCGMERVRVYDHNSVPQRSGIGIYARKLLETYPLLPVEEEGRLNDHRLRENFIERVFAHYRIRQFINDNPRPGALVAFHTAQKLTVMSHSVKHYQELGRLVAESGKGDFAAKLSAYFELFMEALKLKATTRKHTNVLHHIMGYFKKTIDSRDKQEILDLIEQYRTGYLPLIVPVTLLKHHLNRNPIPWMSSQTYLNPYPAELMLRNFV